MTEMLVSSMSQLPALLAMAAGDAAHSARAFPVAEQVATGKWWAGWILWLPLLSMVLCGLCAALRVRNKLPGWITVVLLGISFVVTLVLHFGYEAPVVIDLFRWFDISWAGAGGGEPFIAPFSLYVDRLTLLWMLFVTGLSALIALYATEYMEADVRRGYARFFAGVSVFVFAMSALVMADNLILLYLGWEGVGFASYWLIGYYYRKPSAVAAAKKAFIVNRIGDLGLALGIFLTWYAFDTVRYAELFQILQSGQFDTEAGGWSVKAIPFLFMLGAFGKSAQIPLYVWLPDAMEGPTPVSALIHAATMVTAGVYLLCRMFPLLELHPAALPTVAWIGTLTALLAATIGMAQHDFKRIWAYSTVSQLGYMFAGVGVITTFGAAYHVFTHAFFKAVLFLSAGAIMHGFAGQLDLRKVSGLAKMSGWKITAWTMFVGCLALAGIPGLSGYFSKDAILAEAFVNNAPWIGWILLVTAGLTAYYTFRVWFRVCLGPVHYEPGDEHHDAEAEHEAAHEPAAAHGHAQAHGEFHPHPPRLAINLVLVILAVGALLAALPFFVGNEFEEEGVHGGWVADMIYDSSARDGMPLSAAAHENGAAAAAPAAAHPHGTIFGLDPHAAMYLISAVVGLIGVVVAWYFHLANRRAAAEAKERLLASPATAWLPIAMENKWYVDEVYHALIRFPLWVLGHALNFFDRYLVDMVIIDGIGRVPRWLGKTFQPLTNGVLQAYAVTMAGGIGLVALLVLYMPELIRWLNGWMGGAGG